MESACTLQTAALLASTLLAHRSQINNKDYDSLVYAAAAISMPIAHTGYTAASQTDGFNNSSQTSSRKFRSIHEGQRSEDLGPEPFRKDAVYHLVEQTTPSQLRQIIVAQFVKAGCFKKMGHASHFTEIRDNDKGSRVEENGYLSHSQLARYIREWGKNSARVGKLCQEELLQILDSADLNQDGRIYYNDFMPICFSMLVELIAHRQWSKRCCRHNRSAEMHTEQPTGAFAQIVAENTSLLRKKKLIDRSPSSSTNQKLGRNVQLILYQATAYRGSISHLGV